MELENHPDLGLTLPRMERLLEVHLAARAADASTGEIAHQAEQVFTFATNGFNFQSFADLTFAMFALYSSLNLEDVLKDQSITYVHPENPKNIVKPQLLNAFLSLMSIDFRRLSEALTVEVMDDRLLADFTLFRRSPFWKFEDGAYLCVDPAFLMEKLAEGTYWWVMDGLGPESHQESAERRKRFSSLWGYLFEDYIGEQLRYAHAGREHILHPHPYYIEPNEEAFDSVLIDGTDMVAVQCKGAFLPIAARYSGRCGPFLGGLNKQFGQGAGAAVEQLARNLEWTFGLNVTRRTIRELSTRGVRKIYPLVVVQEPMLGFWLAAKLLVEPFVRWVERTAWTLDVDIRPVVFMTVEEVETIVEYVRRGNLTFAEFLREKLATDRDHLMSVGQFLQREFLPARGIARQRNGLLASQLEKTKEERLSRLESGFYS